MRDVVCGLWRKRETATARAALLLGRFGSTPPPRLRQQQRTPTPLLNLIPSSNKLKPFRARKIRDWGSMLAERFLVSMSDSQTTSVAIREAPCPCNASTHAQKIDGTWKDRPACATAVVPI